MEKSKHFIVFKLNEQPFAIRLSSVQRIARVVGITPLPNAPENIMGIINAQGKIIPVINLRKRFRLPKTDLNPDQHLIFCQTSKRSVALLVDTVCDILESEDDKIVTQSDILPEMDALDGVAKIDDDIVLIHDLEKCLSLNEEKVLNKALCQFE